MALLAAASWEDNLSFSPRISACCCAIVYSSWKTKVVYIMVCLLVCDDALSPGVQFFSHVGGDFLSSWVVSVLSSG